MVSLSLVHIYFLHIKGSTNPLSICSDIDVIEFYPQFVSKDIFGLIIFIGPLSLLTIFWYPNLLGHPDNYIKSNSLITPKHIVPEWYFLSYYAILRSIPNKLGGVLMMFYSILILFILPFIGKFKCNSSKFCFLYKYSFWCFISNFFLLGWLGSCVVEQPYIIISQLSMSFYFVYILIILPIFSFSEKK